MLTAFAVGCKGKNTINNGTPVFTVTASNTHFTSFIVNVSGLTLTRDDGNVFTAMAVTERADLTRITDLTELLSAPALPVGTYKSGTITLDFTTAVINVDVNGQSVSAAAVDAAGAALTGVTLAFTLDPNKQLVLNKSQSTRIGLDFDLNASTIVNTAASPLTVTVTPYVVVSVVLPNSNPIRVHGAFLTADGSGLISLNSRPFSDQVDNFGAVQVATNSSTIYDISGQVYTGSAGLAALGALSLNASIAAVGTITDVSKVTPILTATQVYAGPSLESPSFDHLIGEVSSRSGNVINVHGATVVFRGGSFTFVKDAPLTVGSSTLVNTDGSGTTGQSNLAISIGQHIEAVGQGTIDATSGAVTMDATAGEVRLQPTRLWGALNSAAPGSLVMNLAAIGRYESVAFNFTGTGTAPASDATAASYAVNAPGIDQSATPATTLLRVDGLVNAFGSAPADFNASAVVAAPAIESVLQVEWLNGGATAPFVSSGVSGFVVDLANTHLGTVHEIDTGPAVQDLTLLSASPLIVADPTGSNFSIGAGTGLTMSSFNSFADFAAAVATNLNGTTALRKLVAYGHYDDGTKTFTATRVNLVNQ